MKIILPFVLLIVSVVVLYQAITEKAGYKIIFASIGVIGFSILLYYALRRKNT